MVKGATAEGAVAAPATFNTGSLDYAGIVTIVAGVVCLCLALVWGGTEYEWSDPKMIALLTLACIFIVAFVLIESYVAVDPIMPMRLFKIRNYATASWVSFFAGFAMTAGYVYLPIHFQLVNQNTASQSGVALIPMMLGLPVGAIMCGAIVTSTGLYRDKPIVGAAVLIIANWLYSTLTSTSTPAQRVGYLILGGLALGPLVQVPLLQAQNCVPSKDMAVCSSAQQFFQVSLSVPPSRGFPCSRAHHPASHIAVRRRPA